MRPKDTLAASLIVLVWGMSVQAHEWTVQKMASRESGGWAVYCGAHLGGYDDQGRLLSSLEVAVSTWTINRRIERGDADPLAPVVSGWGRVSDGRSRLSAVPTFGETCEQRALWIPEPEGGDSTDSGGGASSSSDGDDGGDHDDGTDDDCDATAPDVPGGGETPDDDCDEPGDDDPIDPGDDGAVVWSCAPNPNEYRVVYQWGAQSGRQEAWLHSSEIYEYDGTARAPSERAGFYWPDYPEELFASDDALSIRLIFAGMGALHPFDTRRAQFHHTSQRFTFDFGRATLQALEKCLDDHRRGGRLDLGGSPEPAGVARTWHLPTGRH